MIGAIRLSWTDALLLIAGYVALDWMSFFHPLHGQYITPWNPAPALALVFILRYGWQAVLLLAVAVLFAEIGVRSLPASLPASVAIALMLALGYGAIGEALRRRLRGPTIFLDRFGLLRWAGIVVAGTLLTSVAFVLALVALDVVPLAGWSEAVGRFWIGDGVGILVSMPLLWMLFDESGRTLLRVTLWRPDTLGYVLAAAMALWVAVGHGAESDFQYFYLLFLPIIWAASRQGLAGAVLSAAVIQVGLIVVVYWQGFSAGSVLEIQAVTVVLVLAGFFIGVVVDEQQRISAELRQTLRLAAAGEMAGALAHELNQPLTALSAYGAACEELLARGETGDRLTGSIRLMVAEACRAAEVVRRLRDFFRTGTTKLEVVSLCALLAAAAAPFARRAAKAGVELTLEPVPDGVLMADRPQLEVVLRNLFSNAFDAVSEQPPGERRVRVSALPEDGDRICIRVEDSGPGLTGEAVSRLFEPFSSTKSSGLGLGLAISRAIAEAHGGKLWAEIGARGVFRLLLPFEKTPAHA
ncbi:MAG: ATP-binding protein [Candidatus Accumulibacter phosphatis]|jgi:two-component system sensor kinase FixL|uniref:ATP-binding protein n=1 Tax=Candidatus Accumulibacter sp. ACC012 TaxID=2823332 RepID=UPI0025C13C2D|nr:ATP-binding protein [Candidatus Accumulibacter sp. ACC012]